MQRRSFILAAAGAGGFAVAPAILRKPAAANQPPGFRVRYYPVQQGAGSRDVTPAPDGTIWYCCQRDGHLGRLDPRDGSYRLVPLGSGAAPHGVVIGPDGAPWVTEGGQNVIARVDPSDHKVTLFPLPDGTASGNLNTGVFDKRGTYWFTGQNGLYGRLDPRTGKTEVWGAPRGRGPYGITVTPNGQVWYASLAGNYIGRIDTDTAQVEVVDPPTPRQGARRVWTDSKSRLWVSEWNSGNVSVYDPADRSWKVWRLPGERPRCYSVYVDERDMVWLTDFGANAILRFDPNSESFLAFPSDQRNANVRQMDGRPGEAWGGETGTNRLVVIASPTTT